MVVLTALLLTGCSKETGVVSYEVVSCEDVHTDTEIGRLYSFRNTSDCKIDIRVDMLAIVDGLEVTNYSVCEGIQPGSESSLYVWLDNTGVDETEYIVHDEESKSDVVVYKDVDLTYNEDSNTVVLKNLGSEKELQYNIALIFKSGEDIVKVVPLIGQDVIGTELEIPVDMEVPDYDNVEWSLHITALA